MSKISRILDRYLKENDVNLRDFANRCGLSHSYIAKLRHGIDPRTQKPIEPTIDTLNKIAKAMNITLEELLIKAELIDDEAISLIKKNPSAYIVPNKTESEKLADDILKILIDTGEITKEEVNTGKIDFSKKARLLKKVKKVIQFAEEIKDI